MNGSPRLAVVLMASLLHAPGEAAADTPTVQGELGRKLDAYMSRLEGLGFSGSILVTKRGDTVIEKAYGWADKARDRRAATDTVFDLGSITKQFTGAAIVKLEAEGKLGTKDAITRFFKDVPADKQGITLHHLLTHTAGLRSDFASDYDPVDREEYVRRTLASKLLWPPGTRYEYSNAGYSLLAAVVEILSGQSYETYLRERILKPLGIQETGYKEPAWPAERIAHGYRDGEHWGTIIERLAPAGAPFWALRGNGGIHTTMRDVRRWHEALDTDAFLPAEARRRLFTPYVKEDDEGSSQYAYGWVVEKTPRGTRDIWHNGGNGVYMAELHRYVDEGVLVFVASTVAELAASPVFGNVSRIVFGEPVDMPPAAVSLPAEAVQGLAGTYRLPGGGEVTLRPGDGVLVAALRGQDAYEAWHPAPPDAEALRLLTARTREIAAKAFAGDYALLHAASDAGGSLDEVRARETELMEARRARLGAYKGHEVLGTFARPNGLAVSEVRVDFERGSVYNRYMWRNGRLSDLQGTPRLRPLRLVPTAPREWIAFDVATGTGARISITPTSPAAIELQTPAGKVRAIRVS
jgi:CubicO group peptidase (beta-lactamase class C family)